MEIGTIIFNTIPQLQNVALTASTGVLFFNMKNRDEVFAALKPGQNTHVPHKLSPAELKDLIGKLTNFSDTALLGFPLLFGVIPGTQFTPEFTTPVAFIPKIKPAMTYEMVYNFLDRERRVDKIKEVGVTPALDILASLTEQMNNVGLSLTPEQENKLLHSAVEELQTEITRLNKIIEQN